MPVSDEQPLNTFEFKTVTPFGIITVSSEEQLQNAELPIEMTPEGKVISLRDEQP